VRCFDRHCRRNLLKELKEVKVEAHASGRIPAWLTGLHLVTLALVVAFAHHPNVFFGVLVLFLGLVTATREYQDALKLREGLLVGFFLAAWSPWVRCRLIG
jgi:hypothetical protein